MGAGHSVVNSIPIMTLAEDRRGHSHETPALV